MKSVIIYYSLEGSTHLVAKMIAERTGADIIRLKPEKEIPKKGFGKYFWGGKSVIFHDKPKLMNDKLELDNYDTVFIGTPIWAGGYSAPVNTFLSMNQLEGKKIFLFATHKGGGAGKCFTKMKERLEKSQIIAETDFPNVNKTSAKDLDEKIRDMTFLCRE